MLAFFKHLFKLQFLVILVAIFAGIYYPQILRRLKTVTLQYIGAWLDGSQEPFNVKYKSEFVSDSGEKLFTRTELTKYDGEDGTPIYLALLGSVYDVTKGSKHYGSGCSYNFFVGRDASVSFITGEFDNFNEEAADDVNVLKPSDLLSLENWKTFYDKEYTFKGKLIGRFYDKNGGKTKYYHKFKALVDKAKTTKDMTDKQRDVYPDCNIEWSAETGTRVWCTTSSGGKDRAWSGLPRKLFEVGSDSYRCACVRAEDLQTAEVMIKAYDNCDPLADTCYYQVD